MSTAAEKTTPLGIQLKKLKDYYESLSYYSADNNTEEKAVRNALFELRMAVENQSRLQSKLVNQTLLCDLLNTIQDQAEQYLRYMKNPLDPDAQNVLDKMQVNNDKIVQHLEPINQYASTNKAHNIFSYIAGLIVGFATSWTFSTILMAAGVSVLSFPPALFAIIAIGAIVTVATTYMMDKLSNGAKEKSNIASTLSKSIGFFQQQTMIKPIEKAATPASNYQKEPPVLVSLTPA